MRARLANPRLSARVLHLFPFLDLFLWSEAYPVAKEGSQSPRPARAVLPCSSAPNRKTQERFDSPLSLSEELFLVRQFQFLLRLRSVQLSVHPFRISLPQAPRASASLPLSDFPESRFLSSFLRALPQNESLFQPEGLQRLQIYLLLQSEAEDELLCRLGVL